MAKSIIDISVPEYTEERIDVITPINIKENTFVEQKPLVTNVVSRLENLQHCPRCNKPLVYARAINGSESTSFKECPECGTLINTFKPTPYQAMFLRRPERYKMTAGGYGSGKSRSNIEDVIKHILLIPGARVAVTARTYPALEATFVKEFYSIFPDKLVRRKNDQKHEMQLTNGSEILFRSFDDETKLKSINLTMAVIVESSDVNFAAFTMLQSRIRNTAAMIPEVDENGVPVMQWDPNQQMHKPKFRVDVRHINLETNPDSGWVKTKFLLDSGIVEFYGDAYNEGYKFNKERDPQKYTQIISTSANPYLPATYEEEQTRGKSRAYVQQFYKGSFNFSSNLVFPNFGTCIVPPHALPRAFNEAGQRVLYYAIGVDYGINDPTHIIYTAFSTETRKLYVYDELRLNNSDIKTLAKEYRKATRINGTDLDGLLMQPRFDGRSYSKRESNLVTIGSMFEDEGLYFEPSFATHEARIIKMNSLLNHNQVEVFSTCEFLIDEALNYKFKLDKNGSPTDKPEDGNDHGVTALEFVVVELPHNLQELKLNVYLPSGKSFIHDKQKNAIIKNKGTYFDPFKENSKRGNNHNDFGSNITFNGDSRVIAANSVFDEANQDEEEYFNKPLGAWIPK
jgi:phage terminase large subunit